MLVAKKHHERNTIKNRDDSFQESCPRTYCGGLELTKEYKIAAALATQHILLWLHIHSFVRLLLKGSIRKNILG